MRGSFFDKGKRCLRFSHQEKGKTTHHYYDEEERTRKRALYRRVNIVRLFLSLSWNRGEGGE